MTVRTIAAVAALASAAAAGAGSGAASSVALAKCGTVAVRGKVWQVSAAGLACSSAKAVIRTLAAKPVPTPPHVQYPGTYLGMKCIGGAKAGTQIIECIGATGRRLVIAGHKV